MNLRLSRPPRAHAAPARAAVRKRPRAATDRSSSRPSRLAASPGDLRGFPAALGDLLEALGGVDVRVGVEPAAEHGQVVLAPSGRAEIPLIDDTLPHGPLKTAAGGVESRVLLPVRPVGVVDSLHRPAKQQHGGSRRREQHLAAPGDPAHGQKQQRQRQHQHRPEGLGSDQKGGPKNSPGSDNHCPVDLGQRGPREVQQHPGRTEQHGDLGESDLSPHPQAEHRQPGSNPQQTPPPTGPAIRQHHIQDHRQGHEVGGEQVDAVPGHRTGRAVQGRSTRPTATLVYTMCGTGSPVYEPSTNAAMLTSSFM